PGKRARSLGGDFAGTQGLAWSPSGKEIWFAAATSGSGRSIYAVDLRGKVRVVASLPGSGRVQDVSAAGDALLANDDVSMGIRGRAPVSTRSGISAGSTGPLQTRARGPVERCSSRR